MKKETFWKEYIEEFKSASRLRLWFERKFFNMWWAVDKNREFVEQIPEESNL